MTAFLHPADIGGRAYLAHADVPAVELPAEPSYKPVALIGGVLQAVTAAEVSAGVKPVVFIANRLRRRQGSEGTPVVLENGRYRLLRAGEVIGG